VRKKAMISIDGIASSSELWLRLALDFIILDIPSSIWSTINAVQHFTILQIVGANSSFSLFSATS
jgi:hypothetical protein